MEPNQNLNQSLIIKIIGAVLVLGLAGFAFSKMGENEEINTEPITREEIPATSTNGVLPTPVNTKYKDGSYTATGMYSSPAGQEEVEITLTVSNDTVTAAKFVGKASNPGSVKNQELFDKGFKQLVVGKPIDSINLTVVNGSSLTPKGFMDALLKIKSEASV